MPARHEPFDMGMAAAETIALRLPIIWWAFWKPTAASRAEMTRMVAEKHMAFLDTCFAMQMEGAKAVLQPWWTLSSDAQAQAADTAMQAALAPSGRRVKANLRRLRRG